MKLIKSYNNEYKTYSVKLQGLTKHQVQLVSYLFNRLDSDGVIYEYKNGLSLPYLAVHSVLPLSDSRGLFVLPHKSLSDVARLFGNNELPTKDVLCDRFGTPISRLSFV